MTCPQISDTCNTREFTEDASLNIIILKFLKTRKNGDSNEVMRFTSICLGPAIFKSPVNEYSFLQSHIVMDALKT